jgi:carboxy-cis,cis-muconate cyclase
MRPNVVSTLLIQSLVLAKAAKHQLFMSTYGTPFIYTVEFDNETHKLELVANISVPAASQWLSLSVRLRLNSVNEYPIGLTNCVA